MRTVYCANCGEELEWNTIYGNIYIEPCMCLSDEVNAEEDKEEVNAS